MSESYYFIMNVEEYIKYGQNANKKSVTRINIRRNKRV